MAWKALKHTDQGETRLNRTTSRLGTVRAIGWIGCATMRR